jgi:hypothetical protein
MSKRNQTKRGKKNDGVDAKVGGRKGRGLLQVSPVCLPPCIGIKLPTFFSTPQNLRFKNWSAKTSREAKINLRCEVKVISQMVVPI